MTEEMTAEDMIAFKKFKAQKLKQADYNLKRRVKFDLLAAAAMAAGIDVTEDEVDAEIDRRNS